MPLKDIFIDIKALRPTPVTSLSNILFVIKNSDAMAESNIYGEFSNKTQFLADTEFASIHTDAGLLRKLDTRAMQKTLSKKFAVLLYKEGKLDEALEEVWDNDFYFIISVKGDATEKKALASFVTIKDFRQTAIQCKTIDELKDYITYKRAFTFYHPIETEDMDVAACGEIGSQLVGSVTWKFKSVNGVTPTQLTTDEMLKIDEAHGIAYAYKYGRPQLTEGWNSFVEQDGVPDYIDEWHGQDWIKVDMESELAKIMYNTPKLPYDQRGIAALKGAALTSLQRGFNNGIIGVTPDGVADYEANTLAREDQTETDILSRKYRGLSWRYKKSGAIHEVYVNGVISY